MSKTAIYILISIFIIVALHVWAAIYPSHANWGFHFFGFYSSVIGITALGLIIAAALPSVNKNIVNLIDSIFKKASRLPGIIIFFAITGLIYIFIYLFPAKLHLLGDGAVLLRSVPQGIGGEQITLSFRNQPLMFWIYKTAMAIHPFETAPNAHTVYYAIDIFALIMFIALLYWSFRHLPIPNFEKVLLGSIILFGAGFQFFFGYIENYVLMYCTTTAFVLSGWLSLEKRVNIIFPIFFFILTIALHLGTIVFIPSLFILIFLLWKKKKIYAVLILMVISILGLGGLFIIGFNPVDMMKHLAAGSVDFLKLFDGGYGNFPYAMFSLTHFIDLANAHILLSPFGLIVTIILMPVFPIERKWKNPILIFLLATAACGLFFTFVINSALGMARDWDLFSVFFIPLSIIPVYLLSQQNKMPERRYLLVIISISLLIRTGAFIGINSSEEKHLARARMLNSEQFLSKAANMAYDESLANLFFDSERYKDAQIYYEHFMTIDSMNPRIVGNISDVYRKLGEKENYFYQLKRAATLNSPDPGIYSNLGVEYASRGDTMMAIEYNELAVQKGRNSSRAHANLGILYSAKGDFVRAANHYKTAINMGMKEPVLFLYMADCSVRLGDLTGALSYYDIYLNYKRGDTRVQNLRNKIFDYIQKNKIK